MSVNYEYYKIFYYVAKYHGFTRAASALLSSQPNVTRAMNHLEQELGCRLFVRSNRGVTLTPEGERLFAHVSIAQEQLQEGEYELSNNKDLRSGVVALEASEIALHGLLLPVLSSFRKSYPGVRIRISNHSTPQAIAALKSGAAELAVVTTPTGVTRELRQIPLKPFEEVLVAGPQFRALAGQTITLARLLEYPLVCLGRESKTYELYNELFLQHGLTLRPDVEAATADQLLPMIKSDLGLGFVPQSFAAEALRRGEVYRIFLQEPVPQRHICLVRERSRPLGLAAQRLEELLRQSAARLQTEKEG